MSAPLIDCQNVTCVKQGTALIEEVGMQLTEGRHCAIIGPNGAGKTTLARCLLGIELAFEGNIQIKGNALASYSRKSLAREIAYVPQLIAAEIPFTVDDFVSMGGYAHGYSNGKLVTEALELVGMEAFSERLVSTLSGGERQRVCIAAAIAQNAPVIILDEPLAHLDPRQKIDVQKVIEGLKKKATVVVITHHLDWAISGFDQIVALAAGKVCYNGESEMLIDSGVIATMFGGAVEHALKLVDGRGM